MKISLNLEMDAVIAKRRTDYLTSLENFKRSGGQLRATSSRTSQTRRERCSEIGVAQMIEGAEVKFTGNAESCDASLLSKSKRLPRPKKTGHTTIQSSELGITDIIGKNDPK